MDCNQDRLHKKSEELSGFAFVVVDSEALRVLPTRHCILGRIELGGKIKKITFTFWLTLFSLYF